ncbi:MAG: hypothetical protein A3G64_01695 [Candidatus Liptonbacteria bacterium RIFCSPLOWO2_12_FULL_60_15]|uniref:O-methyltransferase domain-containing protein n=1 Tax=Candidatus Liptonbacteria bacterium RIFCSPLOWO2_12_FULL_60_15 TaxID=1798653 RepID=A0A1G2CM36_9BACT|nr:MAG: hypothetical protein A3G64_01695 [Candidatus Liptonbacteria bacterium RIFCSPLOWO2_12_FULL_60_15]
MASMDHSSLRLSGVQQIFSDFIVAELLLALEENGILATIANESPFSVRTVAREARVNDDILRAACDFLAEQGLCEKVNADRYRLLGMHNDIKSSANFLLAYKTMYESLAGLMNDSKRYGIDIKRNGIYYRRGLDAMVAHAFPSLLTRLNELGAKRITGIGANALGFLRVASEEIRLDACMGVVSDEERAELEDKQSDRLRSSDGVRIVRGELGHPEQFSAEAAAEALVSIAVFHDFRPEDRLRSVLGEYKKFFPSSRLFLLEFDVSGRDGARERGASPARYLTSVSRLTHALKREIGPRSVNEWTAAIKKSGWRLTRTQQFESGLVIYECW